MGWTHTCSCAWPFQMPSDQESICIATHHSPNCPDRSFLEVRRVWSHEPQL